MKRATFNFVIDLISFCNLLCLTGTGFIMKWVLPPGTGGLGREFSRGRGREEVKYLWSMTRHEWGNVHFYVSLLFIALMAVHVVMHWSWIKFYFKSLLGFSRKPPG